MRSTCQDSPAACGSVSRRAAFRSADASGTTARPSASGGHGSFWRCLGSWADSDSWGHGCDGLRRRTRKELGNTDTAEATDGHGKSGDTDTAEATDGHGKSRDTDTTELTEDTGDQQPSRPPLSSYGDTAVIGLLKFGRLYHGSPLTQRLKAAVRPKFRTSPTPPPAAFR